MAGLRFRASSSLARCPFTARWSFQEPQHLEGKEISSLLPILAAP